MNEEELNNLFALADKLRHDPVPATDGCPGCGLLDHIIFDYRRGDEVCTNCGAVQPTQVFENNAFSFRLHLSNYKRLHHFHERISQLLIQETPIPDNDFQAIMEELQKQQTKVLDKARIRAVLRSLKFQKYIEKWLQIIYRITGQKPPNIGSNLCQQLDAMFVAIQEPFFKHRPAGRKNFLNYNYVLRRFFQKLDLAQYAMFFPLIKSQSKLAQLDAVWRNICNDLMWLYEPLQHVEDFSIQWEAYPSHNQGSLPILPGS